MPPDPADLWEKGLLPVAERIAKAWIELKGRRVAIDDDLLSGAARQLGFVGSPADPLRLIADPADPRLTQEPPIVVNNDYQESLADSFKGPALRSVAITLPWVHATLPVGHALLAGLPDVLATARQRLASPTLVISLGWTQWPGHEEALRAMGARPWVAPTRREGPGFSPGDRRHPRRHHGAGVRAAVPPAGVDRRVVSGRDHADPFT